MAYCAVLERAAAASGLRPDVVRYLVPDRLHWMPMPTRPLDDDGLDLIFRKARTRNGWQDKPVTDSMIRALYELAKWGPTSANSCPARFVFVRSQPAKERLRPHLMDVNVAKTMQAPCCVIVAYDTRFYDLMPKLFPSRDFRSGFAANAQLSEETAFRNGTLQGAYLLIAARALGLDCGPMSGFNRGTLDAEFFPDGRWRSNFLCNIGYGSDENLFPRNPRLEFEEACLEL
jgi:3-hydroxypropanoate dehydrogenase